MWDAIVSVFERLGEGIEVEQEAGRLAKQGIDKGDKLKGCNVATLKETSRGDVTSKGTRQTGPEPITLHDERYLIEPPTLKELGISKTQSSRWQAVANGLTDVTGCQFAIYGTVSGNR